MRLFGRAFRTHSFPTRSISSQLFGPVTSLLNTIPSPRQGFRRGKSQPQILSSRDILTAFSLRETRARPYLFVGWFWFLITLVPVIGLVQVGGQAMADRYYYLPSIGLFVGLSFGRRRTHRHAAN